MGSELDANARADALIEVMLHFAHFGDQIGLFDQFWFGMPSGENQFHMAGTVIDDLQCLLQTDQLTVDAVVDFIGNDQIILAGTNLLMKICLLYTSPSPRDRG